MKTRGAARRVWTAATAGAIGASMILAACSSGAKAAGPTGDVTSSESPQQAVQTAVSKLGSQSDIKMVLSLPITPAQAKQLSAKSGDKPMTDAEATALTSGSFFLNVATGAGEALDSAQAQTDPKNSVDFGLAIGNNTPLEVVYADGSLYARAQVQQLLTDVGQDPAKAAQFANELGALDQYVPGIANLGKGDWVVISHAQLQSLSALLKQMEASSGGSTNPATLKTDLMSLRSQLLAALQANSTFKNTGADKYSVTVNVASLWATIKPEIEQALSKVPGAGTPINSALGKAQSNIPPGQTAVIDVGTSGGRLSEADVDLNQFAGKNKVSFPVPLRVLFSSPGAPKAPAGATPLDISKLPTLLGSLLGSKSTTTG